ncbi:restriction endonuclease subunit S [Edwardsiella tarda]
MANYKAYPEYKDSGVEWLGEVPLTWQIHSLKRAVDGCTNGVWGGEPDDKHDLTVLRVADFDRQSFKISDLKLTTRSILPKDRSNRLLKQGDLLIEKSGGGDKTLVGCVVLFDKQYEAVTSNFVAKMTPRDNYDGHFLTYAFSQLYAGKVNYPSIKQTTGIQNLDVDAYLMEKFCFPPKHVQRNISCFLDHETAKIDNLIEKQQQLIELLKEKRQAVISHAVTKGLNPDVPMKDSGVEWLGDVPEHWDVAKLSFKYEVLLGKMLDDKKITGKYLERYLRNIDIQWDSINTEELPLMDFRPEERERFSVKKGDLIVCEGGEIGRSAIWNSDAPCFYQKALHRLRPLSNNNKTRFMFYVLYDAVKQGRFISQAGKATIAHLPAESFRQYKFCFPPLTEQVDIATKLDSYSRLFDKLEEKTVQQIALLKERRTALISAAVTGKIDVRDWVAPDTQKSEEPQEVSA